MDNIRKVVVTTSRDAIREKVAEAIRTLSQVTITVIDKDGIHEVSFRVTVTSHDSDAQLDTLIGVVDPSHPAAGKQTIQVFIPTTGEITATITVIQTP